MNKVLKELYSYIIKKYTNETIYCFEIQIVKLQKKKQENDKREIQNGSWQERRWD